MHQILVMLLIDSIIIKNLCNCNSLQSWRYMHWMCTINSKYLLTRILLKMTTNGLETDTVVMHMIQQLQIKEYLPYILHTMIPIMEFIGILVQNGRILIR